MDIPVLESERLLLRAIGEADFEAMARFYADPVSVFYGGPVGREEAWRKFAVYPGHWQLRGYGPWALETKDTRDFVGISGPWYPEGWFAPEITWALLPEHHGNGYATEAAARALQAAYDEHGWTTAVSVISTENQASIGVATRLGAVRERTIDFRYGQADVYRHVSPDSLERWPG